jgi:hypothetical protein
MSRGRLFLIDAGGLLGMLSGMGIATLVSNRFDPVMFGAWAATATAAGLGIATFLSKDLDESEREQKNDPILTMLPISGGHPGLSVGVVF